MFAVQALYQMQQQASTAQSVIVEFVTHRLGDPPAEDMPLLNPDRAFFRDLVAGTAARRDEIDGHINRHLPASWPMERLDPVLLAIMRAATYELLARPDIPTGSVINDYLHIAHLFFGDRQAAFVNGVLDAVARDLRAGT
ncbi:MAG: transcription antitermination factor NusB [Alphaproteobacteria bacterium]|nr:MAG: transcription antitermination factor NusB [Alphaproteobacteria bacterium]